MKHAIHSGLVAVAALLAMSAEAANRPSGFRTICNEGKTCNVMANTNVAFGRAGQFFYRVLSGSFVCNEATFGARAPGGVNECSIRAPLPPSPATGSSCVSTGTVTLNATVVVEPGTTFDGGCQTFIPGPALENDGSMGEEVRSAVFRLSPDASLKNVIIGGQGALGVEANVTSGSVTHIDNVRWQTQGGYAVRITGTSPLATLPTVNITNAYTNAMYGDRIFQANAPAIVKAENFIVRASGSLGPSTYVFMQRQFPEFETRFSCTRCDIANVAVVFRSDDPRSTALLKDSRLAPGVAACRGYAANNCQSVNVVVP